MAKCSSCKRQSDELHKRGGAVYCPNCLKEYQRPQAGSKVMYKELKKKLAEWAGLKPWVKNQYGGFDVYAPPDSDDAVLGNLTESLDACFKQLVPKYIAILMESASEQTAYEMLFYKWLEIGHDALALCLAIEKLIDEDQ